MWVYEDADEDGAPNLYVHHDIILPAFPLSLAWLDCHLSDSAQTANLAAVRACKP
jgi:periodic tryptophan protein 1